MFILLDTGYLSSFENDALKSLNPKGLKKSNYSPKGPTDL